MRIFIRIVEVMGLFLIDLTTCIEFNEFKEVTELFELTLNIK